MCEALNVSRSGYYAFIHRPESKSSQENKKLLETIKKIHEDTRKIYGAPRITKNLPEHQKASVGRVARLMKANGIKSKTVKKYKATTNSNHNLPVTENLTKPKLCSGKTKRKVGI